jgi:outer membrane protein assembly factor BamB
VACHWTTRCCSAFALTIVIATPVLAQKSAERKAPTAPLGLFPATALWDLPLNNLLQATPVFKNDRGYFPIAESRIAAYDVRHGTLLWIAPAQPQLPPTLGDKLLYAVEPDAIVALRDDTGVEAWRTGLTEPLAGPMACHNGWLIATTKSGAVLAFRAGDGALIWRRDLDALIHGSATLAGDRVYVPMTDGRIVALNVTDGEPVWERRLGGAPNDITATDDLVYAGSNDKYFYAVRSRDGQIAWRWPTGGDVVGRPVVDSRRVYFVSLDNVLRALDKNIGNQRWKRALPLRPTRGLVVMGDWLIVSGLSGSAAVFATKDGAPVGTLAGPGELAAQPHVVTGEGLPMVVLVSRDLTLGTIVRGMTRAIEPQVLPMTPLPNPAPPPVAPPPLDDDQPEHAMPPDQTEPPEQADPSKPPVQPVDIDRATEDAVMP